MDWLRRNWPDLIIGVALVAVVALIVVTLLSGGSLASLVRRGNPPELAVTDTTPPNDSSQTPVSNNSGTPNSDTSTNASDTPNVAANSTDATDGGVDVFVPGVPGGRPDAVPDASAGQTQAGVPADSARTNQAGTAAGGAAQNAAAPADTGPLPEAVQDGGFRVAAGAVDSRDAAVGLAESYRDAGYTVTVEQQNDLYLLWIGPYAARDGAERVASRLIADDVVSDALVYTYSGPDNASDNNSSNNSASNNSNPDDGSSAAAPANNASNNTPSGNETASVGNASDAGSSSASAGTSPTATADNTANNNGANTAASANTSTNANAGNNSASATATPPTNPATATGQRYLQVGAFASDESAQPLREQLGALGFNVTQSVSDSGLVRLLVGPFGAAQLNQAQERLAAQGVTDAFPVIP